MSKITGNEPKKVKATFRGIEFEIPAETAVKVLRLQKIIREQREKEKIKPVQ